MTDEKKKPASDYEVGYGRPPTHSRFKPGSSGNPNGRPRKSKDLNRLIQTELDKTIPIKENGRERRISKREAVITQLINCAIKGDVKPLQLVLSHLDKHREIEPFTPTDVDDAVLLAALSKRNRKEDDHGNS